ncbi:MAG: hypothetical protein ABH829_02040 [archaeon]
MGVFSQSVPMQFDAAFVGPVHYFLKVFINTQVYGKDIDPHTLTKILLKEKRLSEAHSKKEIYYLVYVREGTNLDKKNVINLLSFGKDGSLIEHFREDSTKHIIDFEAEAITAPFGLFSLLERGPPADTHHPFTVDLLTAVVEESVRLCVDKTHPELVLEAFMGGKKAKHALGACPGVQSIIDRYAPRWVK